MKYSATINTPGYLPESEPLVFDTAADAWRHLADVRAQDEDDADPDGIEPEYSDTYYELKRRGRNAYQTNGWANGSIDTVYGPTPGGRIHDLGLAYTVDPVDVEDTDDTF